MLDALEGLPRTPGILHVSRMGREKGQHHSCCFPIPNFEISAEGMKHVGEDTNPGCPVVGEAFQVPGWQNKTTC